MKFIIFAHSHCTDGLVAASIMKYSVQMNSSAEPEVIFISYGKEKEALEKANIDSETTVYCVDFAFNKETTLELCKQADKVVVLDHHKTAYENLSDLKNIYNFYFIFDIEESGASIVYSHCRHYLGLNSHLKLNQREVVSTIVSMVKDRDLWIFRLPMTREFSEYIFAYIQPNDISKMTEILFKYKFAQINTLCQLGSTIMHYKDQLIEKKLKSYNPIYINFGSTRMLIINETQPDLVSSLGNALCKQYDIPVCLYNISGSHDGVISVALSFRSMDHLEPVDAVARLFSGGGHRNAAACSVTFDKFNELLCQF